MDADILRLILLVLGGLVVVGIYLWERNKRINARVQAVRKDHQEERREPVLDAHESAGPSANAAGDAGGDDLEQALHELGDLVSEEVKQAPRKATQKQAGKHQGAAARTASKRSAKQAAPQAEKYEDPAQTAQEDLFADEVLVDSDHYRNADPSIPALILQINVVSSDGDFEGQDILRVMQGVNMLAGDMHIFHRRDGAGGHGPVLFSMASMVEPGNFPLDAMEDFKTPGLTLFAQLPGPQDGLAIFSDMLFSAERIATELGGELQDETHSRLTKQTIGHIRGQILEHRRKVQLAKSSRG